MNSLAHKFGITKLEGGTGVGGEGASGKICHKTYLVNIHIQSPRRWWLESPLR